jgi:hypothetical protein
MPKPKRAGLTLRVHPRLGEDMRKAAAANGRSLNEEIIFRLEKSLWEDETRMLIEAARTLPPALYGPVTVPQTTSLTVPPASWPLPHNRAGSHGPF